MLKVTVFKDRARTLAGRHRDRGEPARPGRGSDSRGELEVQEARADDRDYELRKGRVTARLRVTGWHGANDTSVTLFG